MTTFVDSNYRSYMYTYIVCMFLLTWCFPVSIDFPMVQPPIFGEALVQKATGATRAVAFDHNLRAKQRKEVRANFPWFFPLLF